MSKLEQIQAFITVVEANSFAAAARKMGVSTAAISRQVSRLEQDLNAELLERTTRKIALTEVGSQYFAQCKKTITELLTAETAIHASRSEATGILTVTCSKYFAKHYVLPRLAEFMALHPKLQIKLELAERFPNLVEENIDILFGVSIAGSPDLVCKRVATTRYVLCASPEYLKKYGTPKIPKELSNHYYITHSIRNPDNIITFKNNQEIVMKPILWLNDSRAMLGCAIQGMGIVMLHDYVVADALKSKHLVEILKEFQETNHYVYLYYRRSRYLHPKIRSFIDFFTK